MRRRQPALSMKPSGCSQHHPLASAHRSCFSPLPLSLSLFNVVSVLCAHALFIVASINNLIEKQGEESDRNVIRSKWGRYSPVCMSCKGLRERERDN